MQKHLKAQLALGLVSSVLTFCAGFMALSYWFFASDFSLLWWVANGVLVVLGIYLGLMVGKNIVRREP